jgi:hypothetical protein
MTPARHAALLAALPAVAMMMGAGGTARAQMPPDPGQVCRAAGSDDTLRPIPPALADRARALFAPGMPVDMVLRTTVYRCAQGRVLLCNAGANLACGKADTRRTSAGATAWCSSHPDGDAVPLYAVGHDSLYRWRCRGGRAEVAGPAAVADAQGFIARNWQPLPPP